MSWLRSPPLTGDATSAEQVKTPVTCVNSDNFSESARRLHSLYTASGPQDPEFLPLHSGLSQFLESTNHISDAKYEVKCLVLALYGLYCNMVVAPVDGFTPKMLTVTLDSMGFIATKCLHSYGHKNVNKMGEKMPAVWDALWARRSQIISEHQVDSVAFLVREFVEYYEAEEYTPRLGSSRIVHLAFMGWFYQDLQWKHISICAAIRYLLGGKSYFATSPLVRTFSRECADEYGTEKILSRAFRDLEREDVVNLMLHDCLSFLYMIMQPQMVRNVGAQAEYTRVIIQALRKQEDSGDWESEGLVWTSGMGILLTFFNESIDRAGSPMIEDYHIATVLGRGVLMASASVGIDTDVCVAAVEDFTSLARRCKASKQARMTYSVLRRDIRSLWYPTLRTTKNTLHLVLDWHPALPGLLEEWEELGAVLDLYAARERARRFCEYQKCTYSGQRSTFLMRACTGCRKVCYCDRGCQRADWEEHKKMCAGRKKGTVT